MKRPAKPEPRKEEKRLKAALALLNDNSVLGPAFALMFALTASCFAVLAVPTITAWFGASKLPSTAKKWAQKLEGLCKVGNGKEVVSGAGGGGGGRRGGKRSRKDSGSDDGSSDGQRGKGNGKAARARGKGKGKAE